MLRAYAGHEAPKETEMTGRRERELAAERAPLKLAYLGQARDRLALLLEAQAPREEQEAVATELLMAVFDVDAVTAQGLAGLPPKKQLQMLERQGALRTREAASKSSWERMMFARMLPRKPMGLAEEAWAGYVAATRALARGTWRYFRG